MTSLLTPTAFGEPGTSTEPRLSLAVAAYLARFNEDPVHGVPTQISWGGVERPMTLTPKD